MSCYHPLTAIVLGIKENGKKDLKILSGDPLLSFEINPGLSNYFIPVGDGRFKNIGDVIYLPCGHCIGCRLDRSRQWADRCMLELEYHESSYFVTLTYNDEHVPISSYCSDLETGEASKSFSLRKRHFQLFMKRLRKRFSNDKIRFFACGEYGETTLRPHYHAIIFGLRLDDLVPFSNSNRGYQYYTSASFEKCWTEDDSSIGFCLLGEVTWETCAYTARYIMKKLNGAQAVYYDLVNIEPEFTLMSRRPGIARQYYDEHKDDIYEHEYINISTEGGGRKIMPPKYYDKLFDIDYPDEMAEIKAIRQRMAKENQAAKLKATTLYSDELRRVEEHNKKAAIKSLRRDLV
ncbi:replication initiation protein [Tortoise microvirus 68]|nr:replication initiation protein [Tortoise microvirus 68]